MAFWLNLMCDQLGWFELGFQLFEGFNQAHDVDGITFKRLGLTV